MIGNLKGPRIEGLGGRGCFKGTKHRYFSGVYDQGPKYGFIKNKSEVIWLALHCNMEIYDV